MSWPYKWLDKGGLRDAAEDLGKGCLEKCFVADTPVQMADGSTKRIVDVQVGDQVKSRDPATGKDEIKTVTSTIERHAPVIVTVALHEAKTGASETLTCTPEHPFFVTGQGWVEAGSLGIGTSIVTRAGPQMAVASVTWQKNKAEELASTSGLGGYTVYNLTVDGDHTFFVGTTGGGTKPLCLGQRSGNYRHLSGWRQTGLRCQTIRTQTRQECLDCLEVCHVKCLHELRSRRQSSLARWEHRASRPAQRSRRGGRE